LLFFILIQGLFSKCTDAAIGNAVAVVTKTQCTFADHKIKYKGSKWPKLDDFSMPAIIILPTQGSIIWAFFYKKSFKKSFHSHIKLFFYWSSGRIKTFYH
jgi:hypothetical protein